MADQSIIAEFAYRPVLAEDGHGWVICRMGPERGYDRDPSLGTFKMFLAAEAVSTFLNEELGLSRQDAYSICESNLPIVREG